MAPLLAREYPVIVPDCRGHGQSSNPRHSYAFKEVAADVAGLVRALGYERAHSVGHSNGGNVALVTLLEHPEVVQTAIPQAANAYISPDLPEREPPLFDPDYVARAEPEWKERMIALHGPTHGPAYWRDLLKLTMRETITEPDYTPADLARVQRPTLVIQGEKDGVNAPARQAQFIAQHIPADELWIPAGVAHNGHFEAPLDWLKRVLDFLARRGDEANEAPYRLRQARYSDERETIFQVRASGTAAGTQLSGQVLTAGQQLAAVNTLPAGSVVSTQGLQLLLTERLRPDATGVARSLSAVKGFAGTPYLWGDRTPFGFDCSGLAQAFWDFMGIAIPGNADQQFRAGVSGNSSRRARPSGAP